MPANHDTAEREADAIAEDIRKTQDDIGATVDALEDKMTPREIGRSLVGDEGVDLVGELLETTRRNPIPVAMIAAGAIWLLATSSSPFFRRVRDKLGAGDGGEGDFDLRPRSAEPAPIGPPPPARDRVRRRPKA